MLTRANVIDRKVIREWYCSIWTEMTRELWYVWVDYSLIFFSFVLQSLIFFSFFIATMTITKVNANGFQTLDYLCQSSSFFFFLFVFVLAKINMNALVSLNLSGLSFLYIGFTLILVDFFFSRVSVYRLNRPREFGRFLGYYVYTRGERLLKRRLFATNFVCFDDLASHRKITPTCFFLLD